MGGSKSVRHGDSPAWGDDRSLLQTPVTTGKHTYTYMYLQVIVCTYVCLYLYSPYFLIDAYDSLDDRSTLQLYVTTSKHLYVFSSSICMCFHVAFLDTHAMTQVKI